jgi:hypothetical protein
MRHKVKHSHLLGAAVKLTWHTIPEDYSNFAVRTSSLTRLKDDYKRLIGEGYGRKKLLCL